eukprot:760845-Hanusia_phi.AAC.7
MFSYFLRLFFPLKIWKSLGHWNSSLQDSLENSQYSDFIDPEVQDSEHRWAPKIEVFYASRSVCNQKGLALVELELSMSGPSITHVFTIVLELLRWQEMPGLAPSKRFCFLA